MEETKKTFIEVLKKANKKGLAIGACVIAVIAGLGILAVKSSDSYSEGETIEGGEIEGTTVEE